MQTYESLFWSMAIGVLWALVGGWLMGRFTSVVRSLSGVAAQSIVISIVVAYQAICAEAGNMAALLTIAAFMFSLVIGIAATLLARRVRGERQARSH